MESPIYDVAVLGAGIAGSVTAMVLARNGLRTLLIDAKSHPRFAIGESTISQTTLTWRAIAQHFDVPDLAALGDQRTLERAIGTSCGLKRHFGFVYHEPGEGFALERSHQFGVPEAVALEAHLYRQDVDSWLAQLAVRYGAEALWNSPVADVEETDSCMRLFTRTGRELSARYVVDCSGYASPIAKKFNLRETPTPLKTHSRSLFSHMVEVRHLESLTGERNVPYRWSQGTLHHGFKNGWMWVIPFDNHGASSNPRCSVGVLFDPRHYPAGDDGPEAELTRLVARFPVLGEQFAEARAIRPWTSTPRIQYSSKRIAGDRYVLASHAAAFVDPLFSRGLTNSSASVLTIARRVLRAFEERHVRSPFEGLDELHRQVIRDNDDLVHGSYVGSRSYVLWDAWLRVWVTYMAMRSLQTMIGLQQLKASGEAHLLDDYLSGRRRHAAVEALDEELWRPAVEIKDRADRGELAPADAADAIYERFHALDLGPIANKAGERDQRYHGKPKMTDVIKELGWFATRRSGSYHTLHSDLARFGVRAHLFPDKLRLPRVRGGLARTLWRAGRDVLGFCEHLANQYPIASLDIGPKRIVVLSHLDLIDEAFVRKSNAFGRPQALLDAFKVGPLPTAEFLMSSSGLTHRQRRRVLGPAFTPSALAGYAETMVHLCDETIDNWRGPQPVMETMTELTLDVAGLTFFGTRIGNREGLREAFEQWTQDIDRHFRNPFALPRGLPTPWNRKTLAAVDTIARHLEGCMAGEADGTRANVMQLLRDASEKSRLDPKVIQAVTLTLYLAGHDTTATALAWSLYLLAEHPEVIARLRREADAVLGDRTPAYGDYTQLPYALGVYKEALRLYPPTFGLVRESQRDVTIGGYRIPPRTLMFVPVWGIHRDPRHFDDPLRFMPERWQSRSNRGFFPFGAGPFSCLGALFAQMEGVLMLARLAQRTEMRFRGAHAVKPTPGFSLKPAPDFYAELTPRAATAATATAAASISA